jgi:ribosomal protein L37E
MVVASSHQKDRVIAPLFLEHLGIQCEGFPSFNSDEFGTFSGEVERKGNSLETARMKCEKALEHSACQLAIASEGSFGPHPHIGFVPVDEELIFFVDRKNKIEASFREISLKTNYGFTETKNWDDVKVFAEKSMFPSHALIVSSSDSGEPFFVKGIQSWDLLRATFDDLNSHSGAVKIQTDMRAMFNPTRMHVIEAAVLGLVNQLKTCCDDCGYPNFHIKEVKRGLPCASCGFPTQSVLSYVFRCESCNYTKESLFPKGKSVEDAMYCDCCNP